MTHEAPLAETHIDHGGQAMRLTDKEAAEAQASADFQSGHLALLVIAGMVADSRGLVRTADRRELTDKIVRAALAKEFPVWSRTARALDTAPQDITLDHIAQVADVRRWFDKGSPLWPLGDLVHMGLDGKPFHTYPAPNPSATDAPSGESTAQRRDRLKQELAASKATGRRDYARAVAEKAGITTARLRQLIGKQTPALNIGPTASDPFGQAGKRKR